MGKNYRRIPEAVLTSDDADEDRSADCLARKYQVWLLRTWTEDVDCRLKSSANGTGRLNGFLKNWNVLPKRAEWTLILDHFGITWRFHLKISLLSRTEKIVSMDAVWGQMIWCVGRFAPRAETLDWTRIVQWFSPSLHYILAIQVPRRTFYEMEIFSLVFLNSSSDPGEMRLGGAGSGGRSRGPGLCWAGQAPSHPWSRELMSPDVVSWTPGQYLRPSELVL